MSFAAHDGSFRSIDKCVNTGARVGARKHIDLLSPRHNRIPVVFCAIRSKVDRVYLRTQHHVSPPPPTTTTTVRVCGQWRLPLVGRFNNTTRDDPPLYSSICINVLSETRVVKTRHEGSRRYGNQRPSDTIRSFFTAGITSEVVAAIIDSHVPFYRNAKSLCCSRTVFGKH